MSEVAQLLLDWYALHARSLPWRSEQPDPYQVWVSEIMLQQTRVETVIPYFERWLELFPHLPALAQADEQTVLRAWEGLGYYSRARNLHRAAQIVVSEYGGQLPQDAAELAKLPGIGRYTAGAIASIAFGKDEPALDGNLRRVAARVFDMPLPARSPQGERRLEELLRAHMPSGQAGRYNQALMDLGALVCTPRDPACTACPLRMVCAACRLGLQSQRPVLPKRPPVPHYLVTAAVIRRGGRVLLTRRPAKGLLGGLWEFPGGKLEPEETLAECLQREIREELGAAIRVGSQVGVYRHAYTHFKVTLHAFEAELLDGEPRPLQADALEWVPESALAAYPMGKIDRQIAAQIVQTGAQLL
jgi:A/G-specific adenine glycosylase